MDLSYHTLDSEYPRDLTRAWYPDAGITIVLPIGNVVQTFRTVSFEHGKFATRFQFSAIESRGLIFTEQIGSFEHVDDGGSNPGTPVERIQNCAIESGGYLSRSQTTEINSDLGVTPPTTTPTVSGAVVFPIIISA